MSDGEQTQPSPSQVVGIPEAVRCLAQTFGEVSSTSWADSALIAANLPSIEAIFLQLAPYQVYRREDAALYPEDLMWAVLVPDSNGAHMNCAWVYPGMFAQSVDSRPRLLWWQAPTSALWKELPASLVQGRLQPETMVVLPPLEAFQRIVQMETWSGVGANTHLWRRPLHIRLGLIGSSATPGVPGLAVAHHRAVDYLDQHALGGHTDPQAVQVRMHPGSAWGWSELNQPEVVAHLRYGQEIHAYLDDRVLTLIPRYQDKQVAGAFIVLWSVRDGLSVFDAAVVGFNEMQGWDMRRRSLADLPMRVNPAGQPSGGPQRLRGGFILSTQPDAHTAQAQPCVRLAVPPLSVASRRGDVAALLKVRGALLNAAAEVSSDQRYSQTGAGLNPGQVSVGAQQAIRELHQHLCARNPWWSDPTSNPASRGGVRAGWGWHRGAGAKR